jgi:hypothetical protein
MKTGMAAQTGSLHFICFIANLFKTAFLNEKTCFHCVDAFSGRGLP